MATPIDNTYILEGSEIKAKANKKSETMKVAIAYGAMITGIQHKNILSENISNVIDESIAPLLDSIYSKTKMLILKSESKWLGDFLNTNIVLDSYFNCIVLSNVPVTT